MKTKQLYLLYVGGFLGKNLELKAVCTSQKQAIKAINSILGINAEKYQLEEELKGFKLAKVWQFKATPDDTTFTVVTCNANEEINIDWYKLEL